MRFVALLLLAAAIGFAIGRLTAPEAGGLRGQRPAAPPVVEPRAQPAAPGPAPERAPEARPVATEIVRPSVAMEAVADGEPTEGGWIDVDFEGFDGDFRAWTAHRTMRGGYEEDELWADEGQKVVAFSLTPGVYDVWWLDAEGRRRGSRAVVETGKRTLLRAAERETAPPIPEGLGILDVVVMATWGGALPCCVLVSGGPEEETGVETGSTGHGSTTLYPGKYTVWVGGHKQEATVTAGQVTTCRITHDREGDLLLDMGNELVDGLAVAVPGEPLEKTDLWIGRVNGVMRCGIVYLPEGEYDVCYVRDFGDQLGVPLGHASIHAGQTTWLSCRLPQGGLVLRVTVPASTRYVTAVISDTRTDGQMDVFEDVAEVRPGLKIVLAPGHYAVTVSADNCEAKTVEVDVADHMVELNVALAER